MENRGQADPQIVALEGQEITLVPLDELEKEQQDGLERVRGLRDKAGTVGAQAGDKLTAAGQLLLASPSRWPMDGVDRQVLEPAQVLAAQLETSRAALEAIDSRPRHGLTGVLGRMGDSMQRSRLEAEIAKVTTDLRPHLLSLAQSAPTTTFPEADELRREASKLQQQAREATGSADQLEAACNQRADEIKRRHEAM